MCGIAGYLALEGSPGPSAAEHLRAMTRALRHRGPDSEGYFSEGPVGLGVRRLKVNDLATGEMPMAGCDPRVVVIQNGEIYNFRELRAELEGRGHRFASRSDTEVLVHLYEERGPDLVERLVGMFAFAIWDGTRRRLVLARDHTGIKPLHLAQLGRTLLFASEIKGLLPYPGLERRLDPRALSVYLAQEYVPAPWTLWAGIEKLRPAERLVAEAGQVRREIWWRPRARAGSSPPPSAREAGHRTIELLRESVRGQLVSDVPLGVLLSGGVDSSSVARLAADAAGSVVTFSVGFEDPSFDESRHSRALARRWGFEHHEEVLTPGRLLELIPRIGELLDEPLGDPSLVPSIFLCRFARERVTVALGGDGGDELFLGYPTFTAHKVARIAARLPAALRDRLLPRLADLLPPATSNLPFEFKLKRFLRGLRFPPPERHLAWMGAFLPAELQRLLAPPFAELADPLLALRDRMDEIPDPRSGVSAAEALDLTLYLPDDLLVKVDRASMQSSLEVRVPFLDHRLVEYALSLPLELRMPGLRTKALFRRAVRGLIPDEVIARPKKGFGIPVSRWLRGPLRPLAEELLEPGTIARQGIFRPEEVGRLLREHMEGRRDQRKALWTLLVFQLWWRRWMA